MEKYIMALDQGTTSSRCILFNKKGEIVCQENVEFEQIFPQPGWVEHNPEKIWLSQYEAMRLVMDKANVLPKQIDSIGITNQRETTIIWDKHLGKPVYNAIVWQCRRTADIIDKLESEGYGEVIHKKTGLIPDAYFSGSKIKWIMDNVAGAEESAKRGNLLFGTVDTWLMWKLSDGAIHATDYTNASRTMLYNIFDLEWDKEILDKLNIYESMLPKVMPSSGIFGYTDEKIFGARVPISGVAGDQQAALFGQCCFEKGDVKNTYGTGCFLLMNIGKQPVSSDNGLLTTIAASVDENPDYAIEGSVFVAGAAIQWLRDELRVVDDAPQSEELAVKVEDTDGVYVVPAFTGMGAPYWEQNARGMIVGLTRGSSREHLVRATLEALAYQTYDVLKAMEQDCGMELKEIKVDGGACTNNFLLQFQADILQKNVSRPRIIETTGLGAAYLAGLATGYWKDKDEIKKHMKLDRTFVNGMSAGSVKRKIDGWHRAVKCALVYAKGE